MITTSQLLAGLAGLAVIGWPHAGKAYTWAAGLWQGLRVIHPVLPLPSHEEPAALSYQKAIDDLAGVRSRLKATACLKEEQLKAIDVLTLALVAGSDQ